MHLLVMYLIGLILGLGFYALTHYFSKKHDYTVKLSIVAVIGILFVIGSFAIGGFGAMPYTALSIGILTIPIVIVLIGKKPIWRQYIFVGIGLVAAFGLAFSFFNKTDYWVISKHDYDIDNPMDTYIQEVQNETNIRGYKRFTISEGNKGIVLSLGEEMAGTKIEVLDVVEEDEKTIIYVNSVYNKSTEKNPMISIGFNRLKSVVEIRDTDGTLYEQVKN